MTKQQAALKVVEDVDPVDPLRNGTGCGDCRDPLAREQALAEARQAVDRLTALVEKAEAKRSSASTQVEFERTGHIGHLVDGPAQSRPPELMPLSPARRSLAEAMEEVLTVQAALEPCSIEAVEGGCGAFRRGGEGGDQAISAVLA